MNIKRIVDFYFTFNGMRHHKKDITFSKEMLIEFIGKWWYDFFFDEDDKLKHKLDMVLATARELGKTYVAVAVVIYLMINDPFANFVLTRKYGAAAGSFYEMFNKVLNDWTDKFDIEFTMKWSEEVPGTKKTKDKKLLKDENGKQLYNNPTYKVIREIKTMKGRGVTALFSYGKTGDDKLAIFYNSNYDQTQNQICFLRGADDADGSRGLSVNVGYIVADLLEEYSQEVDRGKLEPDEQVNRYASLYKSSNRYSTAVAVKHEDRPIDLRTLQLAMANIWDQLHPYNVALLKAIPEDEWREFVEEDPENNTHIVRTVEGITYMRGTSAFNTFLYPKGSHSRKNLIEDMKIIAEGQDDYKKAEVLGYTFPGFLKSDNPLEGAIRIMMDCPVMDRRELKEAGFEIEEAEFGADPGLRDNACSVPAYYIQNHETDEDGIYIDEVLVINNKQRRRDKLPRIKNPVMKKMFLEFWEKMTDTLPIWASDFLVVNMDVRATGIRDDFNHDIFIREDINGKCSLFPSTEGKGYGCEQRPNILQNVAVNMILHPQAKSVILLALKTLEKWAEDKRQPHPRKGEIDIYDALMYAIVKLRHRINQGG